MLYLSEIRGKAQQPLSCDVSETASRSVPEQSSDQLRDIFRRLDHNDGLGQRLRQIHLQHEDVVSL